MVEYVGIGEIKTARGRKLAVIGLGSCVCVAMYDEISGIGGVSHAMLPEPPGDASCDDLLVDLHADPVRDVKYAMIAVPVLMRKMILEGAKREHLKAKIASGASIFRELDLNIGSRNVAKVKEMLKALEICIVAEDTGGNMGRTVIFDTCSWNMHIRTRDHEKTI